MKNTTSFLNRFIVVSVVMVMFVTSCSKDEKTDPAATATAKISGTVTTPSGKKVPSATVMSGDYSTKTNINGTFELMLPAGNREVIIQTGQGRVFKTVLTLNLSSGQHLVLPGSETVLLQILDLAYIYGIYDEIQVLIHDSLGYNATQIQLNDLNNISNFSQYGGLFLNCGLLVGGDMSAAKYSNLMDYAMNYGSIYASDYAVECLTGDGHLRVSGSPHSHSHSHDVSGSERTATTCISPMIGGFIPDSALCTQKLGPSGLFTNAVILDPDLIIAAGTNSVDIDFDLGSWEVVNSYDAPFTPYITHSNLGVLALKADLNELSSVGGIYFTTFHNMPQGVSNEVEAILNYIILNL